VANDDVTVSVEVTTECDVGDNDKYSFEFVVSSVVFSMFVSLVLKISVFVSDIVELLFGVVMDAVDSSFVCSTEESVYCSEASEIDTTVAELEPSDICSVVVVVKTSIVVSLVEVNCNEDERECSVELETF
jgi:hypothetical protein